MIDGVLMFDFSHYEDKEALKETIKETCGQIDFYGNKVLKLEKDLDTKWYQSFKELNDHILAFVLSNSSVVSQWRGKEDPAGAEAFFNELLESAMAGQMPTDGSAPASSAPAQQAAAPKQAASAGGAGSLADKYKTAVPVQKLKDAAAALNIA